MTTPVSVDDQTIASIPGPTLVEANTTRELVTPAEKAEIVVGQQVGCSICLEANCDIVKMPCCHREDSTMHYCRRCLEILCDQGTNFVGRCPTCRTFFTIEGGVVANCENIGQCRMCRQSRVILDRNTCDACLFGSLHVFTYECSHCHCLQRIPHPMWRYQPSPNDYSTVSWACHARCKDYRNWKIVPGDVARVPVQDLPPSWDRQDDVLEAVRRVRAQEGAVAAVVGGGGSGGGERERGDGRHAVRVPGIEDDNAENGDVELWLCVLS